MNKVQRLSKVKPGESLVINPADGVEFTIHNIHYSGAVEVYFSNGTDRIKTLSDSSAGECLVLT